jgi:hypothetical protein
VINPVLFVIVVLKVVVVSTFGGHSGARNWAWTGADPIGFPLVLFKTCKITSPSAEIEHTSEMLELVVVVEVLLPLRISVDEPRPATNANTVTVTMIAATVSFFIAVFQSLATQKAIN